LGVEIKIIFARLDSAVGISQFLEIRCGFLKKSVPDFAEPVEAIVVPGGGSGWVHDIASKSSKGVTSWGV
jgi:hypothetical protein